MAASSRLWLDHLRHLGRNGGDRPRSGAVPAPRRGTGHAGSRAFDPDRSAESRALPPGTSAPHSRAKAGHRRVGPRARAGFARWQPWLGAVLILLAALCTTTGNTFADVELLVVVHPSHPKEPVGADQLRPIFKVQRANWPSGTRAVPINLPETDTSRQAFDRAVLGWDPDTVAKYWIDRKIRGNGRPPRKVPSPMAVVASVAAEPGAVGYVPTDTPTERVRVVARVRGGQVLAP
jgi:hypothetical protein